MRRKMELHWAGDNAFQYSVIVVAEPMDNDGDDDDDDEDGTEP